MRGQIERGETLTRTAAQSGMFTPLVLQMFAVGEETGELDVMLYKVADYYEEEVEQLTDGMMKMIEPLMIIFLGLVVLFIVASLFMPLIAIISGLTSNK